MFGFTEETLVGPGAAPGSEKTVNHRYCHSWVLDRLDLAIARQCDSYNHLYFFIYFLESPLLVDPADTFSKQRFGNETSIFFSRGGLRPITWRGQFLSEMLLVFSRWVYSESWTSDLHQLTFPSVLPLSSLRHCWGSRRFHHGAERKSSSPFHGYPWGILHSQCQLQSSFWWKCLWQQPGFPPYVPSFVSNHSTCEKSAWVLLARFYIERAAGSEHSPRTPASCRVLNWVGAKGWALAYISLWCCPHGLCYCFCSDCSPPDSS